MSQAKKIGQVITHFFEAYFKLFGLPFFRGQVTPSFSNVPSESQIPVMLPSVQPRVRSLLAFLPQVHATSRAPPPPSTKPRLMRPLPPIPKSVPKLSSTFNDLASAELNKSLYWKVDEDGKLISNEPPESTVTSEGLPVLNMVHELESMEGKEKKSSSEVNAPAISSITPPAVKPFEPGLTWPSTIDDSVILLSEPRMPCEIPGCRTLIPLGYALDHMRFAAENHVLLLRAALRL